MKRYIKANDELPSQAFDADADTRFEVAKKTPSQELLEVYARDPDECVRWAVANNTYTPEDILAELSQDSAGIVQETIAHNSNTPQHILVDMASRLPYPPVSGQDLVIAAHLANNPSTPAEVLEELMDKFHISDTVTVWLAKNPNTPVHILQRLSESPCAEVSMMAKLNLRRQGR